MHKATQQSGNNENNIMIDFLLLHLLLQEKSGDGSRKDNAHRNNIATKQLTE